LTGIKEEKKRKKQQEKTEKHQLSDRQIMAHARLWPTKLRAIADRRF
jgi:hypothetical protein